MLLAMVMVPAVAHGDPEPVDPSANPGAAPAPAESPRHRHRPRQRGGSTGSRSATCGGSRGDPNDRAQLAAELAL